MKQDYVIRILFVEDEVEKAEAIISVLRNNGIAVRPQRAGDEDELDAALEKQAPDLVLASTATSKLELGMVSRKVAESGKDISVLAVADHADDDLIVTVFAHGLRGIALRKHTEQMQAVVRREFDALTMRRKSRRLESALRESERRCDSLLDSSREPVAYIHEGMHVRANRAYLELFGLDSFEDLEGLTLLDLVAESDAANFRDLLKRMSRGEKPPEKLEIQAQRVDGDSFQAVMQFARATFEGESCLQIIFRRQEIDPELSRKIEELSWRDPLTGLFNRKHMLERIDGAVEAAAQGSKDHALLLVDPDSYRATLDNIGLGNADDLLHGLAEVVAGALGDQDAAGRINDHTLAVLSNGRNYEAVTELAERIRQTIEKHIFEAGSQSISITASVGASMLSEKNATAPDLLDLANGSLRAVQERGGNQIDIHNPAAQEMADAKREQEWLETIRNAIDNDGFVLFQQQVVSLQGAEGEYYEVLLRMNGPNGEILPGQFLPAAARHGLLPEIDHWVVKKAIDLLAERLRDGQQTTLLVKLTPQSVNDPKFAAWIGSELRQAKVPGKSLVLEMPESKVITNLKPARTFVNQIREVGCSFALEQFGSGLNSFQLLQHIAADYLKIDRSFLADLPKSQENQQRVREICAQAAENKRMVIAEWVQDAASTSILFSCGVHFVQGNFLQEPVKIVSAETVH